METTAVLMGGPRSIALSPLALTAPQDGDVVVEIRHSGISTGTEKLLWSGTMPTFPGMGYPLVPGYESVGEVVEAMPGSGRRAGQRVFVPGADCYRPVRGLFGGASRRIVTRGARVVPLDPGLGPEGVLIALAATARHAIAGVHTALPDLIVGHGVVGRLLARLTLAAGGPAPMVWDVDATRLQGAAGYPASRPEDDPRRDYRAIYDVSGHGAGLDALIARLAPGGEIVLAGFYTDPLSFTFPPAFLREARIRVAAQFTPDDIAATCALVEGGMLSLDGLITHTRPAAEAEGAYATAFSDPACLKMLLDWKDIQ